MTGKKIGQLVRRTNKWFGQPGMDSEINFFQRWSELLESERAKEREGQTRWRIKNIDKYRSYHRKYSRHFRAEHPEAIRETNRRSYAANRDARRAYARAYRAALKNDPVRLAQHNAKRAADRRARAISDPQYRFRRQIRTRIWMAVNKAYGSKAGKTFDLIGCTREQFMRHIESTWMPGMSWENYGLHGWHIDHKVPLALFDLTKPSEQFRAFHYTNTQAMWAKSNLSKGSRSHRQLELDISLPSPVPCQSPTRPNDARAVVAANRKAKK